MGVGDGGGVNQTRTKSSAAGRKEVDGNHDRHQPDRSIRQAGQENQAIDMSNPRIRELESEISESEESAKQAGNNLSNPTIAAPPDTVSAHHNGHEKCPLIFMGCQKTPCH